MNVELILKVAGVAMIVAIVCQILSRVGRDDQATLVSVSGIVIIFLILIEQIGEAIRLLFEVFGL